MSPMSISITGTTGRIYLSPYPSKRVMLYQYSIRASQHSTQTVWQYYVIRLISDYSTMRQIGTQSNMCACKKFTMKRLQDQHCLFFTCSQNLEFVFTVLIYGMQNKSSAQKAADTTFSSTVHQTCGAREVIRPPL